MFEVVSECGHVDGGLTFDEATHVSLTDGGTVRRTESEEYEGVEV